MRFFTPEWLAGHLSADECDEVIAAYERHLEEILPRLPATLRLLARELVIQEARVRRVVLDRPGRELRLELRCGDDELGWYDLDLTYLGAVLDSVDADALAACARDTETTVLYDEVDLTDDGALLHRVLFWPHRDCEIMFRSLAMRIMPRADGTIPVFADRWVESG